MEVQEIVLNYIFVIVHWLKNHFQFFYLEEHNAISRNGSLLRWDGGLHKLVLISQILVMSEKSIFSEKILINSYVCVLYSWCSCLFEYRRQLQDVNKCYIHVVVSLNIANISRMESLKFGSSSKGMRELAGFPCLSSDGGTKYCLLKIYDKINEWMYIGSQEQNCSGLLLIFLVFQSLCLLSCSRPWPLFFFVKKNYYGYNYHLQKFLWLIIHCEICSPIQEVHVYSKIMGHSIVLIWFNVVRFNIVSSDLLFLFLVSWI